MNSFKSLQACLVLTVGGVLISSVFAADARRTDAFLDRWLPAGIMKKFPMLGVSSFWGGVRLLSVMSGKTVRLPKELAEWPGERTENDSGGSWGVPENGKVRESFERVCMSLNLTWRYDAEANVIDLEPAWKNDHPRPGKELVEVLLGRHAARVDKLETSREVNRVGGHSPLRDPWRLAFDELLSRPENFPLAGSIRLYHDSHGHETMLFIVENIFTGRLLDSTGHSWVVVLNEQESISSKEGPGDLACYLFDEDGKFARGVVYAIGSGPIVGTRRRDDRTISLEVNFGRRAETIGSMYFALVNGDLVLQGTTLPEVKGRTAEEIRADFPAMGSASKEVLQQKYRVNASPTK